MVSKHIRNHSDQRELDVETVNIVPHSISSGSSFIAFCWFGCVLSALAMATNTVAYGRGRFHVKHMHWCMVHLAKRCMVLSVTFVCALGHSTQSTQRYGPAWLLNTDTTSNQNECHRRRHTNRRTNCPDELKGKESFLYEHCECVKSLCG